MAYVLDRPQIGAAVAGCKSIEELDDALRYYDATDEEKDYAPILPAFADFSTGECVYCNHCVPCPSKIDIGRTTSLLEQGRRELTDEIRASYAELRTNASDCIACGQCSSRCPFGVDVIRKMEEAVALFA